MDYPGNGGGDSAPNANVINRQGSNGGNGSSGQPPIQPMQVKYKFTAEELRALRECNRESFYYRCLPIGTTLGTAAFYGVKYGYLSGNPRFGAWPKVLLGCTVGYFIGKFSYQRKCVEKIMALPNSPLAQILRKQRDKIASGGGITDGISFDYGAIESLMESESGTPATEPSTASSGTTNPLFFTDMEDRAPTGTLDMDSSMYERSTAGSTYTSIENDYQMGELEKLPRNKLNNTYDALRKKSRDEYMEQEALRNAQARAQQQQLGYAYTNSQGQHQQQESNLSGKPTATPPNQPPKKMNAYGDVSWTESD